MHDYFKTKTWVITVVMFVIAFSLSAAMVFYEFGSNKYIKTTSASADNNASGWAWNSNIGWISFNCTNDSPACGSSNYGVSIDLTNGHFSGYAWSANVGWISFNETGAPDYAFNAGCVTAGSCAAANNCTACYNWSESDRKVHGWAKILSMGDNGWIKFDGSWTNPVSINPANDEFSGWAWNANSDGSGIGWVSFNCANDNSCGISNYKTIGKINRPPTVSNLTAPNWDFANAGGPLGALNAYLNWQFNDPDGNAESAYQIIVNNESGQIFNSGVCTAYNTPSANCKVNAGVGQFPLHSALALNYNTSYYWWIKVWDNALNSLPSALTQYNVSQDDPIEADDGAPLTFTTYKHEMPDVDFTWFPTSPSRGEEAKFTDASQVYLSSAPSTAIPCDSVNCRWQWSATANVDIVAPTASTTIMKFNSAGNARVTLTVTDLDNYSISTSKDIIVSAKLPKWKEVKPE